MNAPATPKGLQTRERILKASGRVFSRRGYAASGVADICKASDLAVGGFYRYFSGKEDVLKDIVADLGGKLSERLSSRPPAKTAEAEIRAVAERYFAFVEENKAFYQTLREAEFVCGEVVRRFNCGIADAIASRLSAFRGDAEACGMSAWAMLGLMQFYAAKFLIWEGRKVPAAALDELAGLIVRGAGDPGPLKPYIEKTRAMGLYAPEAGAGGKTEARLLAAAEKVFGSRGYAGAHVSEITRAAGYATGTFYTGFKSKKDALAKLISRLRDGLVFNASAYSRGAGGRLETEVLTFIGLFRFLAVHPHGYRIMREAEFVDFALAGDYYIRLMKDYARGLAKSARPGELNAGNWEYFALAMMGVGHMLALRYLLWNGGKIKDDTMLALLRTVFNGFENSK